MRDWLITLSFPGKEEIICAPVDQLDQTQTTELQYKGKVSDKRLSCTLRQGQGQQ